MPDCEFTEAPTGAPAGVPVIRENPTLTVFPNPASDLLNVTGVRPAEIIRFDDLTGREIQTSQVSSSGNLKLDISLFPEVFFLRAENGSAKKVMRIK